MSRGAFEVARAGMGGSPRGAEGAAAAKALMRPPLRPSRRDLNSLFSLELALIGLGRAPFWLLCSPQEVRTPGSLDPTPVFLSFCPSLHLLLGLPSVLPPCLPYLLSVPSVTCL